MRSWVNRCGEGVPSGVVSHSGGGPGRERQVYLFDGSSGPVRKQGALAETVWVVCG